MAGKGGVVSRRRQLPIVLACCREQEGWTGERIGPGDEVRLSAIGLINGPEVVITQAQIEGQVGKYLPVVLEIRGEILLLVVGLVNVRGLYLVGASQEVDSTRNSRGGRIQQKLCSAGRASTYIGNVCVTDGTAVAVVTELTA